ncbi:MAG: hypothetical protein JRG80_23625 [Deltaproteobacteria bacterium]|nr:hypothetical protein [Deltaproteobacteria bacterium]
MIFDAILEEIVDGCGGGIAAALMGNDGISIAEVVSDREGVRDILIEEIGTAGAEFGRILAEIAKASDALGGGAVQETAVVLTRPSWSSRSRRMATSARRAISSVDS